ncbi:hypothetical protein VTN96DRAFT_3199 [Rasamsonia emersonii]
MSQSRVITIQNENYELKTLISERVTYEIDDRTEVYSGLRQRDARPVILKLRYQRPPQPNDDPADTAAIVYSGKKRLSERSSLSTGMSDVASAGLLRTRGAGPGQLR